MDYVNLEKRGNQLAIIITEEGRRLAGEHYGADDSRRRVGTNEMLRMLLGPQLEREEWHVVAPENAGALTSAFPLLADEVDYLPGADDGLVNVPTRGVYWNPNYQVEDEVRTLLERGEVLFMFCAAEE